jgi:hypothetical protein
MLATVSDIKARLGVVSTYTADDAVYLEILKAVSAEMAGPAGAGRPLEELERTEYFSPERGDSTLWLGVWPVVEIDAVVEASYGDFASADELTLADDYYLVQDIGELHRVGTWLAGRRTVKVTYTAGFVPAETAAGQGFSPEAGQVLIPDDLRSACLVQAIHEFSRRKAPGATGESVQSANVSLGEISGLLPQVKEVCQKYRRVLAG